MKTPITLIESAHMKSGAYRLPTDCGEPSIYVLEGAWFQAIATDDQGNEYFVFWTIREDYDPDSVDESNACDWDAPRAVVLLDAANGKAVDVSGSVRLS